MAERHPKIRLPRTPPERVTWAQIGPEFMRTWGRPRGRVMAEHLEILGPTGSGKSYFEAHILHERARRRGSHVVVIATKPADETLTALGWPVIDRWPPSYRQDQVIFWPRTSSLGTEGMRKQRTAIMGVLQKMWEPHSNRIVVFDEIAYLEHELKMKPILTRYYREARTLGITIVASTQRPQGITRYMHSESTWAVFFAPKDEDDAERMAQVAGNKHYFKEVFMELDRSKFEFVMVRNLTGETYITHL